MWINVAIGVAFLFVLWQVLRPKYDVTIVLDRGVVERVEGIAQGRLAGVTEFLERDLAFTGRLVILGTRTAQGPLRLRFRGGADAAQQQRIRNFLAIHL